MGRNECPFVALFGNPASKSLSLGYCTINIGQFGSGILVEILSTMSSAAIGSIVAGVCPRLV